MPDIEDIINKAIQEGKFDDLPGKGKPLALDENAHGDPEWRLAHHIIKSSGYTLPWIRNRQEILDELDAARSVLKRAWNWRQAALSDGIKPARQPDPLRSPDQVEHEWQRALAGFTAQIEAVNKKIFNYNLEVPADRFQLFPANLASEVAAITQASDLS